jgi:hypothetical protein
MNMSYQHITKLYDPSFGYRNDRGEGTFLTTVGSAHVYRFAAWAGQQNQ